MSTVETNLVQPSTGTSLTLGASGDTISIPSGATIANSGTATGFGGGLANVQFFTSSGTYTRTTDVSKIIVAICGGGGGGGGGRTSYGYEGLGGAGAGFCYKYISSAPSTSTITIGSGGAGGGADTNGTAGGASSYADGTITLTANGGDWGYMGGWTETADGGTASGGNLNITGANGGVSPYTIGTTTSVAGGSGGACAFPFTNAGSMKHSEVGDAGQFGSGGSGGGGNNSYSSTRQAGAGGGGCCIIWEYI